MDAEHIIHVFNQAFERAENTVLIGGADEPLYLPACTVVDCSCGFSNHQSHHLSNEQPCKKHRIYFRLDYASSALHEISHWCIAGKQRRLLEDYGYWYSQDGRSEEKQKEFEHVEVKPQALEAIFSSVCGVKFFYSADNLNAKLDSSESFEQAVNQQVSQYQLEGLPPRAFQFFESVTCYLSEN